MLPSGLMSSWRSRFLKNDFRIPCVLRPFFRWFLRNHTTTINGNNVVINKWWITQNRELMYLSISFLFFGCLVLGLLYFGILIPMLTDLRKSVISQEEVSMCKKPIPNYLALTELIQNHVSPDEDILAEELYRNSTADELISRGQFYRSLTDVELSNGYLTLFVPWLAANMSLNLFDVGTMLLLNNKESDDCYCASQLHLEIDSFSFGKELFMAVNWNTSSTDFRSQKCDFGRAFDHFKLMASDEINALVYDNQCGEPRETTLSHALLCCLKLCQVWNGVEESA